MPQTTEIKDETCKVILISLLKGLNDFAEVQREISAGSYKTVKNHIKNHLVPAGLTELIQKKKGLRIYYEIKLTENGKIIAQNLKGK